MILLLLLASMLLAPGTAFACSACLFGLFQEIFPFLRFWIWLFMAWSVIFLLWYLTGRFAKVGPPGKSGRIVIEMIVLFFLMMSSGFTILLAYWAYVVGIQTWSSWKGRAVLPKGVRMFGLGLNGVTTVLLIASVAVSYAGYGKPENLIARLKGSYNAHDMGQQYLRNRIVERGAVMAPMLRKALEEWLMEAGCMDHEAGQGSEKCLRGESAAGLLGDIRDESSVELLASAISRAAKKGPDSTERSRMSRIAEEALKKIGTPKALRALEEAVRLD
jgi:hypothetical protein